MTDEPPPAASMVENGGDMDNPNVQVAEEDDIDDGMENWVTEQSNGVGQASSGHGAFGPNIKEDGYVQCIY